MLVISLFSRLNTGINRWFTQPEPNAAGSMGLFRIIYSLFYLWHLSVHSADFLSGLPGFYVEEKVYLVRYFFADFGSSWSPLVFYGLESLLVAALVLLAFGYKTRAATVTVLIIGGFLEALSAAVDGKRTLLPMVFYIPFFMSLYPAWDKTYSLDAMIERRRSSHSIDPHASDWEYFLPSRALLVVFSILFLGSAVFKVAFGGAWLSYSDMMANFFLNRNIEAAIYDLPLNWLAPFMAQSPLIYLSVHLTTLIFETFFFVCLINRRMRNLVVSMALLFHAVNALWLVVTVTPILIGYCAFINWQGIKDFFFPAERKPLSQQPPSSGLPPKILIFIALFLAASLAILWHSDIGLRSLLNLNGLLNWRTVWYPILPISLGWFVLEMASLLKRDKTHEPST